MPPRLILHHDIAERQSELRDFAAPDDFVLMRRDTPYPFPAGALAYCADLQSERVLYTLHGGDLPALFGEPFLYAAQLRAARAVVTVPYEQLALVHGAAAPGLVPVFSPGRTGSTLLARMLAACGVPCASEPDMPTQICRFTREDRRRIGPAMEVALLRACFASLQAGFGGEAGFVKLRSHCNARPLQLVEAAGAPFSVFMLRRFGDWAVSRFRAFGESPQSLAAIWREAADALDKLVDAGGALRVIWFEELAAAPASVLAPLLGRAVDGAALAGLGDSQEGTALARSALAAMRPPEGFLAALDAAWGAARLGAEWSATTCALLAQAGA